MHLRFVSAGEATTGGFFHTASTGNTGNGTNSNTFSYVDLGGNTYDREVTTVDNNITFDYQGGTLVPRKTVAFPRLWSSDSSRHGRAKAARRAEDRKLKVVAAILRRISSTVDVFQSHRWRPASSRRL
ncbi:hypothetical protein ACG7TL_008374 [Trametes sanguinea]